MANYSRKSHNGGIEEMLKRMKLAKGKGHVKVGIQEGAGQHEEAGPGEDSDGEPLSVADVASFHEFGTDTVPQRSFIRAPIQANRETLKATQAKALKKVIQGTLTIAEALGLIGLAAQSDMVAAIDAGIDPALDPKTVARKGSSKPLIDSGQLKQSIRFKVEA